MCKEGLYPILKRGYSLFLPLGIFDSDLETFAQVHFSRYNKAYDSYQIVATCVKLIGKNPFVSSYYDLLESKSGKTEEFSAVRNYFDI